MGSNEDKKMAGVRRYEDLLKKQTGRAVRPYREDSYVNVLNRYGTEKDMSEHYQFQQEPLVPDETLAAYYESNGLFAKIVDTPAEEAIKHGFTLEASDQKIEDFYTDALEELDWDEKAMTAIKWARLFGGSIVVMLINDGRGLEEPLDWKHIQSIDDLRVFDRSLIQEDQNSMFNYFSTEDPFRTRSSRMGMPEYYDVFSEFGSFRVHDSRCLVFQNGILPENTTNSTYQFWGMPEYIRIHRAIRDAEVAHGSAVKLLDRSIQAVYKMKDLSAELATEEGESRVLRRLQTIDMARGLLNSITIDAEGEDYDFRTFQFSGVSDVVDTTCNYLSALTSIPQTILFGRSPAGMNSTGDADLENWYNYVERIQTRMVKKNLRYLLSVLFQAGVACGEVDEVPALKVVFNPLWSLSESEQAAVEQQKAQTQQVRAQTAALYMDAQVLDPSEIRKKLADSDEFDIETILDEYDDDELFPETEQGGEEAAPSQSGNPGEGMEQGGNLKQGAERGGTPEGSAKQGENPGADMAKGLKPEGSKSGGPANYPGAVNVKKHETDPGKEGDSPAAAPAATKLPQDMSTEDKEQAEEARKKRGDSSRRMDEDLQWITLENGEHVPLNSRGQSVGGPTKGQDFSDANSASSITNKYTAEQERSLQAKGLKSARTTVRDLRSSYTDDGEIDDDVQMNIIYKDKESLHYPEDVDRIKLQNIAYAYTSTTDDESDTAYGYYVATLTPEQKDDYFQYVDGQYGQVSRNNSHYKEVAEKFESGNQQPHYMTYNDYLEWMGNNGNKDSHGDGGPGSGNFGHRGRPGEIGGSASSGGTGTKTSSGVNSAASESSNTTSRKSVGDVDDSVKAQFLFNNGGDFLEISKALQDGTLDKMVNDYTRSNPGSDEELFNLAEKLGQSSEVVKQSSEEPVEPVSPSEALSEYQDFGYREVNSPLRNGEELTGTAKAIDDGLQEAFEKYGTQANGTYYRYTGNMVTAEAFKATGFDETIREKYGDYSNLEQLSQNPEFMEDVKDALIGYEFTDKGYVSSSSSYKAFQNYAEGRGSDSSYFSEYGCTESMAISGNGATVVNVGKYGSQTSKSKAEKEYLFNKNSTFKVKNVEYDYDSGSLMLTCDYINKNNDIRGDSTSHNQSRHSKLATRRMLCTARKDGEISLSSNKPKDGSVGVLLVVGGCILCATRMRGFGSGLYGGPGGHVEDGETLEEAAIRETEEEYGVTPKNLIMIGYGPWEPDTGLKPAIFLTNEFVGDFRPNDEVGDMAFRSLSELREMEKALFQPFRDSLNVMLEFLGEERFDGGPGSGDWGHEGREGQVGGSKKGGGTSENASGYDVAKLNGFIDSAKEMGGDELEAKVQAVTKALRSAPVGSTFRIGNLEFSISDKYPTHPYVWQGNYEDEGLFGINLEGNIKEGRYPEFYDKEAEERAIEDRITQLKESGDFATSDYVHGEREGKITASSENFGEAGDYVLYRSGDIESSGMVFFAPEKEGADHYAGLHDGITSEYEVALENPLVVKADADGACLKQAYETLHPGKTTAKNGISPEQWKRYDKSNAAALNSKDCEYDSIIYVVKGQPAEVQISAKKAASDLKKTADYSTTAWSSLGYTYEGAVRKGLFDKEPNDYKRIATYDSTNADGGPGSGYHDHPGRPGQVGGSAPSGSSSAEANERYQKALAAERKSLLSSDDDGEKGLAMFEKGFLTQEQALKAMEDGTIDEKVKDYFDIMQENGNTVSEKPTTENNICTRNQDVESGKYDSHNEAKIGYIQETTGLSEGECSAIADQLSVWTSNSWKNADSATLDKFIENDHTYDGEIYRGLSFGEGESSGYDSFMSEIQPGSVISASNSGSNASWTSYEADAINFSNRSNDYGDSVIIHCVVNRTSSPIAYLNDMGEREVMSHSRAQWTVLSVNETTKSQGGRHAEITVVERGDYAPETSTDSKDDKGISVGTGRYVPMLKRWEKSSDTFAVVQTREDGGPGSGNWGHKGRPGEIGGSAPSTSGYSSKADYEQAKSKAMGTLNRRLDAVHKKYDSKKQKIRAEHGNKFNRRMAVHEDNSLTEEEKQAKLAEIEGEFTAMVTEEIVPLSDAEDAECSKIDAKYQSIFEPDYEYEKIDGEITLASEAGSDIINPDKSSGNCQRCAVAYEMRERGYDVQASEGSFDSLAAPSNILRCFVGAESTTLSDAATLDDSAYQQMMDWGEGSRAIVCTQSNGYGHAYNLGVQDGVVHVIDTQIGATWSSKTSMESSGKINLGLDDSYAAILIRTDNATPGLKVSEYVQGRK